MTSKIPGADSLIKVHGGTAYYCTVHKKQTIPITVESDDNELLACEECFLQAMIDEKQDFSDVVEDMTLDAAIGDHQTAEDAEEEYVWENMYL